MNSDKFKFNENITILVHYIMKLLKMNWDVQINHSWHEQNISAYWLANYNIFVDHLNLIVLGNPSSELQKLLFDDISETCMSRNVCFI